MKHILIAGAGGIGQALGLILLHFDSGIKITYADKFQRSLDRCKAWFDESTIDSKYIQFAKEDFSSPNTWPENIDIVADCLPGSLALKLAEFTLRNDAHYLNLTEHILATEQITALAAKSSKAFVLQCGLAPGYINILACQCYTDWQKKTGKIDADLMEMRVGALTYHVSAPSFYGFTWSPIGVATEYVKPSIVVENNEIVERPSLTGTARKIIFGVEYEEGLTSGGAASLPDEYHKQIKIMNYKSLRFPGHYAYVHKLLEDPANKDPDHLLEAMKKDVPFVSDDKVIIYAGVSGADKDRYSLLVEKAVEVEGKMVAGKKLKAIQTTTAGALAQVIFMLLGGQIPTKGAVFQHQIDPQAFLNGKVVSFFY